MRTSQVELSEEVNEIIGSVPKWPIRLGTTIIFVILLFAVLSMSLITFPRQLDSKFRLIPDRPPCRISAIKRGYIEKIYRSSNSKVEKGEVLLSFNEDLIPEDLDSLRKILDEENRSDNKSLLHNLYMFKAKSTTDPDLNRLLAELEEELVSYNVLELEFDEVHRDIDYFEQYRLLERRRKLTEIGLRIEHESYLNRYSLFMIDSLLYIDSVISFLQFKESVIQNRISKSQLIALEKEKEGIKGQLVEHTQEERNANIEYEAALMRIEHNIGLKSSAILTHLNNYERQNYIRAPQCGTLHYSSEVSVGKVVESTEQLMIIEKDVSNYIAIIEVSLKDIDLIRSGQKVLLELTPYPALEYGRIEALVSRVGEFDVEGSYFLEVDLPSTLITDRGKELTYFDGMKGKARVIVEEQTLLQRLLARVSNLSMGS